MNKSDSTATIEDRLRRTLTAVADTVTDDVVGGDEPRRGGAPVSAAGPAHRARPVLVAVAATALVAGGLGWLVGRTVLDDPSVAGPAAASTTSAAVNERGDDAAGDRADDAEAVRAATIALIASTMTGAEAERALLCAERAAESAVRQAETGLPAIDVGVPSDVVELPLRSDLASVIVLLVAPPSLSICTIGASSERPRIGAFSVSALELPAPGADGVVVDVTSGVSRSADGESGPGEVTVIGRAADSVRSIRLTLPDQESALGVIVDGWFAVRSSVADGRPLFDGTLTWTAGGDQPRRSRVDLLDRMSPAEACALRRPCVALTVRDLQREADLKGLDGAAEALADGELSDDEWFTARESYVACLVAGGLDAHVTRDGVSVGTGGRPDALDISAPCDQAHQLIVEAREYLDAQRRVDEG